MPAMMVWPVSWSVETLKDGSSCASLESAVPSLSWSARVLGSTATRMTGAGNSIASSTMGLFSSHTVSPVVTCFMPPMAMISPALASSMSSRLFACMRIRRPTRSFVPLTEL